MKLHAQEFPAGLSRSLARMQLSTHLHRRATRAHSFRWRILHGATPGALTFQKGPVLWRRRLCFYLLFTGATPGALPFQKGPVSRRRSRNSLSKEIKDRMVRLGDGGVKLPVTKEGCEDTRESLAEDEQFWADRDESRSTKLGEWVSRRKLRTEEIPAIADTNKILNEDEAR